MTEDALLLGTLVPLLVEVVVDHDHAAVAITILLLLKDINLDLFHLRIDDMRKRGHTLAHHHLIMGQGFAVEVL